MPENDFNFGFKIPFRNYILDDLEVTSLIEDRFYGAFLATFYTGNTSFPLATFNQVGGTMPNLNIIQRFHLLINSYSNETYDQAYLVDKAIFEKLGGQNGPITVNENAVIRPVSTPEETYDEIARLYGIRRRYFVTYIP